MLEKDDPELSGHFCEVMLDLDMIIPAAWLSTFAKWLPVSALSDLIPFLCKEKLLGFVTVSFLLLLSHRDKLLAIDSLEDILPFVNNLCIEPMPDNLMEMCE